LVPKPILSDINFTLEEGEFCIILGSNGSGKSSLLKTIIGEYDVDNGSICLNDKVINKLSTYQRASMISTVVQDIAEGTIGRMTLLENMVLSSLRRKEASLKLYSNHAAKMYQELESLGIGLEKYLHTSMDKLSGGQRQIISTLMATISKPSLLLLDEHTSALDPKTKALLMKYTASKIEEAKITTLMVTHNFSDAVEYGDRIIILHQGSIAFDIGPAEKIALTKDSLLRLFHSLDDKEEC
jgi:putative ABC transport system ATP-binding protein